MKTKLLLALVALLFLRFTTNAQNEKLINERAYASHFNKKRQLELL